MKSPAFALAAVFGTLLAAQPALAGSVAVTYKDLDLSTEEGQKKLDERITKAAEDVCGYDQPTVGSRIPSREIRACVDQTRKELTQRIAATMDKKASGG